VTRGRVDAAQPEEKKITNKKTVRKEKRETWNKTVQGITYIQQGGL